MLFSLETDLDIEAENAAVDDGDAEIVAGELAAAEASTMEDKLAQAEQALSVLDDAIAGIREEETAEGEISIESAMAFAAVLKTTGRLIGLAPEVSSSVESATAIAAVPSLEAEGTSMIKRIIAAIVAALKSAKAWLIKVMDRVLDKGQSLARKAEKLASSGDLAKLDGTTNKVLTSVSVSKAIHSNDGGAKEVLSLLGTYTSIFDKDNVGKIMDKLLTLDTKKDVGALAVANNEAIEGMSKVLGMRRSSDNRNVLPGLINGQTLVMVTEAQTGKGWFGDSKLTRLVNLGLDTPSKELSSTVALKMPTAGEAGKILKAVTELGNAVTNVRRDAKKALAAMDKAQKNIMKSDVSDADGKAMAEGMRTVVATLSRVQSSLLGTLGGQAVQACGVGLGFVQAAVKNA